MKQYHLLIQGDVQGIGYRSWMKREAEQYHIVGWVKNRDDRSVEAVIQGEESQIQQIMKKVRIGPDVAWVEKVMVTEKPVDTDLFTFQVIY